MTEQQEQEQQSPPPIRNEQARAQVFLLLLESGGGMPSSLVESVIVPAMMDFPHDIKCSIAALTLLVRFLIPPSPTTTLSEPSSPTKQQQQPQHRLSQLSLFSQSPPSQPPPLQPQVVDRKAVFVSTGALQQTIQVLERRGRTTSTPNDISTLKVLALCMQLLAEVSSNASDALKNDHLLPCLGLVHHVMRATATQVATTTTADIPTETPPAVSSKSLIQIHQSACMLLRHLSNPLLQELVAAGSWSVLTMSVQTFPQQSAILLEHAYVALYNLLPVCPTELLVQQQQPPQQESRITTTTNGSSSTGSSMLIQSVIQGMTLHPTQVQVQTYGLLVLTRLSQKDSNNYQVIVAHDGLTVILVPLLCLGSTSSTTTTTTTISDIDYQEQQEALVQLACQYLRNLSRHSLEIQRTIVHQYNGIEMVIQVMEHYAHCINIQDPSLATLRNLVSCSDHRKTLTTTTTTTSSSSHLSALVSTILQTMNRYPLDAALQAYGCDALGRVILEPEHVRQVLQWNCGGKEEPPTGSIPSIATIVVRAMQDHRTHAGVQDRAVFLILGLLASTKEEEEEEEENDNKNDGDDYDVHKAWRRTMVSQLQDQQRQPALIDFLKETLVPQHKQDAMERLQRLIGIVEQLQPSSTSSTLSVSLPSSHDDDDPKSQPNDRPSPQSVLDLGQVFPTMNTESSSSGLPTTTDATPPSSPTAKFYLAKGWQLVGQGRAALLGKASPEG
jgi:hypothetical protein